MVSEGVREFEVGRIKRSAGLRVEMTAYRATEFPDTLERPVATVGLGGYLS